ncbi:MAG: polyribonucleotide nucleotidyltransferase [Deltaproteobacteria bacterium CG11_big_fil_rev_8_21_14_0_20_45_16]|nr:MAG: polyribonucleotide nucleotidyltransferase [Deltaproteobacteria bacterium CG11_big_fil_rev_8_21_14_0_20_45_16]
MEIFKTNVFGKEISIETGRMAKQAAGATVVRCGDTMVLATVCMSPEMRDGQDFFPLSVEFQEKTYSAGKIPGGYFKREGKLSEHEVLTSRLIDRPIRPLFPEGFMNETQIIVTVISADKVNEPDVLGLIGASAALSISGLPFDGPVAAVRVGRIGGKFVLNASRSEMEDSDLNILVAGTASAIVMVEGGAHELPESIMVEALFFAHKEIQPLIELQKQMKAKLSKPAIEWTAPAKNEELEKFVRAEYYNKLSEALQIKIKLDRYSAKNKLKSEAKEAAVAKFAGEKVKEDSIKKIVTNLFDTMGSDIMRKQILDTKKRIDGRDLQTVRAISIETGVLPRAHGSTLFTRGETQALVSCTLGAADDSQRIDALWGDYEKHFLLHYNFPPFSVGEVKPMRGPSRRDIGHGNLAERSLKELVPSKKDFPYTIRIVSDILESNGSSSMATVCGGCLALMDAGVPGMRPVAGIAMGLIAEGDKAEVLTDILGDEDHIGDMDFKVTGTDKGVTGFQMDTKISGISMELMSTALNRAKDARLFILEKMNAVLGKSRSEMSEFAPKMKSIQVRQSKIKDVIGPGGKNIKGVIEATGAKIDISDDGTVNIFSTDPKMAEKAIDLIEALTGEIEIGRIYNGVVRKIVDFGAFVNIAPGTDGLVHISELDFDRVTRVEDIVKEGDQIPVKVLEIDRQGRIRLSRKAALEEDSAESEAK